MKFKDREQFINYAQFIPITFLLIWILSFAYVYYSASSFPDEFNGRIYSISYKGKSIYISLIEQILIIGSTIGFVLSFVVVQAISIFGKWNKR